MILCSFKSNAKEHHASTVDIAFPQSVSPDLNTVYIPFNLVGQLIMVQARIDTVSGWCIVDTGSERLVINSVHYTSDQQLAPVVAAGNTGIVKDVRGHQTDSLGIEGLVLQNLFAHITNLGHIEDRKNTRIVGILGYDVFKAFELFIDFANRRIVLFRTDQRGDRVDPEYQWETPFDSLNFTLHQHLIMIPAKVNEVSLDMILDSGAELNLIDRRVSKKVLENFTIIKRVNLVGVGKREVEVLAGTLRDVVCGDQHTAKMNTLLTSLDEINQHFNAHADGVLGYEFLKNRRTLINYTKRKIYFFKPVRS